MKKLLTAALLVSVALTNVFAYPISPRPLRKLIMESDCIVTGYVTDIQEEKPREDDLFGGSVAVVTVREVLQGEVAESEIRIPFNPHMVCPWPPHYVKGTNVVVFLDKEEGKYTTHALSYGLKTLPLPEVELYKIRIQEMQQVLKLEDKDEQFLETVEWLVKCSENSATRYEGVYELSPESDFMSYYDRTEHSSFKFLLTAEQKSRLKATLLSSEEMSYPEFGLVDLIYPGNEKEIFDYLLISFRKLSPQAHWTAGDFMKRLMYYKSNKQLEVLAKEFEDKYYDYKDKNREKRVVVIVQKFIAELEKL